MAIGANIAGAAVMRPLTAFNERLSIAPSIFRNEHEVVHARAVLRYDCTLE